MSGPGDFKLEQFFSEWEFAVRHNLAASDAQTLTIAELLDLAGDAGRDEFERLGLGYTPTWGTDRLREAVAATYDTLCPEHVLVFTGAQEALYWGLAELAGGGDHALVTVPNYQSMETVPIQQGADVEALPLRPAPEGPGWSLDAADLAARLRPDTRLLAVNFPNNPTGLVPPVEVFTALVRDCAGRGIRVFSDEVYRGLEPDPARTLPQAADLADSAVSVGVMSKAYGLPGLRIGWLASRDTDLLARLERSKHWTTICSPAPSELLAALALEAREQILARNRALIGTNTVLFAEFFDRWKQLFSWQPPDGGCVCFPRWLGPGTAGQFCRTLAREAGVLLLPGDVYGSELAEMPADRFRVGLGREGTAEALEIVDGYLASRF